MLDPIQPEFQVRKTFFLQLSGDTREEKSKKKKRLDDIMLGLGASKGVDLVSTLLNFFIVCSESSEIC
jgi:hypothetical protein